MVDKYIYNNAGQLTERNGLVTSAGAGDAGKIIATDASGRLDNSLMPVGIGADTASITTSEALADGDWVNIHSSSGFKVRKADASTAGKEAHGFVLASYGSGVPATVYFEGTNTHVSGQTPGNVYLSTTPGTGQAAAPTGSANVVQRIGFAVSATAVNFQSQVPVVLA
jgi:hypothetical protein